MIAAAGRPDLGGAAVAATLALCAVGLILIALAVGTPTIAPAEIPSLLRSTDPSDVTAVVFWQLRLPRVGLAVVAGACLACAGLVLQEALGNPLAAPDLVGVSSGASFAVAFAVVGPLAVPPGGMPAFALVGALAGGGLTLVVIRRARSSGEALLSAAAVSAALQAGFLGAFALAGELQVGRLYRFLLGSLQGRGWSELEAVWPWLLVAVPALVCCVPVLAVLRLGEEAAGGLGLSVARARAAALGVAVLLVGPVVAVCGPIAWVGLLAPHLARRLHPNGDALSWLPLTALCGIVVVLAADLAARLALAPIETPVGAWTALVGVLGGLALARPRRLAVA